MPAAQQQLVARLVIALACVVVRTDPGARSELVSVLAREHQSELVAAVVERSGQ